MSEWIAPHPPAGHASIKIECVLQRGVAYAILRIENRGGLPLFAAACGGAVWLQGVLFVAVSVVALLATKPLVKKYLRPRIQATNADRCVGRTGVVLEDIDNLAATGQVRVCGSVWSARSTDGAPIAAGTTVVVDRIEGVKLMVRTAKTPAGKV